MSLDSRLFVHEKDLSSLEALKAIPGFTSFVKSFMKNWNEKQFRIQNMSSRLRISKEQLPKYYAMLEDVCEKMEIDVPEIYLELNVVPNAYTYGDDKPFIVVTSGLIETIPDELIPSVLAHECGHIVCHHTLYTTMGSLILNGMASMIPAALRGLVTLPLQMAFAYWMRCSEFSADRAAMIYDGGSEHMIEVCMRLAGYGKFIEDKADPDVFIKQAEEYREFVNDSKKNQTMEFLLLAGQTHPLTAVRAYECREWSGSDAYHQIMTYWTEHREGRDHSQIPLFETVQSYVGKNAQAAEKELRDLGFRNIKTETTSEKGKNTGRDDITDMRINGLNETEGCTWFDAGTPVQITYYEPFVSVQDRIMHPDEAQLPGINDFFAGKNCSEVYQMFIDAGFTNVIIEKSDKKGIFAKQGSVVNVTVDQRTRYDLGEWVSRNAQIVIYYVR